MFAGMLEATIAANCVVVSMGDSCLLFDIALAILAAILSSP
jgi:hypothetical protein